MSTSALQHFSTSALIVVGLLSACQVSGTTSPPPTPGLGEQVRGVLTEVELPPGVVGAQRVPAARIRLRDEGGREWQFVVATGPDPDAAHLLDHLARGSPVTVEYREAAGGERVAIRITD